MVLFLSLSPTPPPLPPSLFLVALNLSSAFFFFLGLDLLSYSYLGCILSVSLYLIVYFSVMEKLRTAGVFDIEVSNMQIDNKYYILKFFLLNYRLKLDLFVFVK